MANKYSMDVCRDARIRQYTGVINKGEENSLKSYNRCLETNQRASKAALDKQYSAMKAKLHRLLRAKVNAQIENERINTKIKNFNPRRPTGPKRPQSARTERIRFKETNYIPSLYQSSYPMGRDGRIPLCVPKITVSDFSGNDLSGNGDDEPRKVSSLSEDDIPLMYQSVLDVPDNRGWLKESRPIRRSKSLDCVSDEQALISLDEDDEATKKEDDDFYRRKICFSGDNVHLSFMSSHARYFRQSSESEDTSDGEFSDYKNTSLTRDSSETENPNLHADINQNIHPGPQGLLTDTTLNGLTTTQNPTGKNTNAIFVTSPQSPQPGQTSPSHALKIRNNHKIETENFADVKTEHTSIDVSKLALSPGVGSIAGPRSPPASPGSVRKSSVLERQPHSPRDAVRLVRLSAHDIRSNTGSDTQRRTSRELRKTKKANLVANLNTPDTPREPRSAPTSPLLNRKKKTMHFAGLDPRNYDRKRSNLSAPSSCLTGGLAGQLKGVSRSMEHLPTIH